MKAILLFSQGYFTDTHDLVNIYKDMSSLRKKWKLPTKHVKTLELLNGFNYLRYPNPRNNPEIGTDDWPRFEALLNVLEQRMAKSLQNEIDIINHLRKGNRIIMRKKNS